MITFELRVLGNKKYEVNGSSPINEKALLGVLLSLSLL